MGLEKQKVNNSSGLFPGYKTVELVKKDPTSTIYRCKREADGLLVLIKCPSDHDMSSRRLRRLQNEYDIVRLLDPRYVVHPLHFETFPQTSALIFEDTGSRSLDQFLGLPMEQGRFFTIAVLLSAALAEIHGRGLIHKDIKPQNVLVNLNTNEIRITDFAIASPAEIYQKATQGIRFIEGSLAYMAPEQTGRTGSPIDHRADLYSLGVTLYEMITGTLPFKAVDALEWIHCHVARTPIPPQELAPQLPKVVSDIILKLLAKNPEDRYQSALGLQADLKKCHGLWESRKEIEPFLLDQRVFHRSFQILKKLYGRSVEGAQLLEACERCLTQATRELIFVSGPPGIGKSAFVHQIRGKVVQRNGFFVSAKFEQYKKTVPYSILFRALSELVFDILSESSDRISEWKTQFSLALGMNAQLVIDLIPQFELIVGKQVPVPELGPADSQNRFSAVFQRFLSVFAKAERPLVLFLDDLQWVDVTSLRLIESLVLNSDTRYLCVIGTYRDNEVSPSHPLSNLLATVRKGGVRVNELSLNPLTIPHVHELVTDTLQVDQEQTYPLAELIYRKSLGNPFFTIQFLNALHAEGFLIFDPTLSKWQWDEKKIEAGKFAANILDLMTRKLQRLSAPAQDLVKLAACLGTSTELKTLATLSDLPEARVEEIMIEPCREGLLSAGRDLTYNFVHDRVQQASYSLIPLEQRPLLHLKIGRKLLQNTSPEVLDEKLMDFVLHFNTDTALITDPCEKRTVASLNLRAAKKARLSVAYLPAISYLTAGLSLLDSDCWARQYELAFPLHLELAQCKFLIGAGEETSHLISVLLKHSRPKIDSAGVHAFKAYFETTQDKNPDAAATAIEGLKLFDINLPLHPTLAQVMTEYEKIMSNLGNRPIADLIHLPAMEHPEILTALHILDALTSPALFTDLNLLSLVSCWMVSLSLRYGNGPESGIGYICFGMVFRPYFKNYNDAYSFGRLGYDYAEKTNSAQMRARTAALFGRSIYPWTFPFKGGLPFLHETFDLATQAGDLNYACYVCNSILSILLLKGENLDDLYQESERRLNFVRSAGYASLVALIVGQQRLIQNLRGFTTTLLTFDDDTFRQEEFEQALGAGSRNPLGWFWYSVWKLQSRFIGGDFEEAAQIAFQVRDLLWTSPSYLEVHEYSYYYALSLAALYDKANVEAKAQHRELILLHQLKFELWAKNCPENFDSKYLLISAELKRIQGEDLEAQHLYEQAIRSAQKNGLIQNQAISYEVAASFYRSRGFTLIADTYIREARSCYRLWGAHGKVRQLNQRFPHLAEDSPLASSSSSTVALDSEQVDILSVIKSSQLISQEMTAGKLLSALFNVVIEHGNAQTAYFLLPEGDKFLMAGKAKVMGQGVQVEIPDQPLFASPESVPISVIQYVKRVGDPVVLEGTNERTRFSNDTYLQRFDPKSVICLPILRKSEVVGILYLENNSISGAFTQDRLSILQLLAAQTGISLENAKLYSTLRLEQSKFQDILDNTTAIIAVKDLSGRYLLVNRRFEKVFHHQRSQVIGKTAFSLFSSRFASSLHLNDQKVLESGVPTEVEERLPHRDGVRTYLSLKFPLLHADGSMYAICSISTDITTRRQTEEERSVLLNELQAALRARDEFISVASHELRTPLTPLHLQLRMMIRMSEKPSFGNLPEGANFARLLSGFDGQLKRLSRLVEELLDVSRIQTGVLILSMRKVNLSNVVTNLIEVLEPELSRAECELRLNVQPEVMGVLDSLRMEQVIMNLLSNALKFGAGKPIEVTLTAKNATAQLIVKDQGIGIAKEDQKRVFERFERAVSLKRFGGLGLGLFITQQIVSAHHGSIEVQSAPGEGSTFTVEIPLDSSPDPYG